MLLPLRMIYVLFCLFFSIIGCFGVFWVKFYLQGGLVCLHRTQRSHQAFLKDLLTRVTTGCMMMTTWICIRLISKCKIKHITINTLLASLCIKNMTKSIVGHVPCLCSSNNNKKQVNIFALPCGSLCFKPCDSDPECCDHRPTVL